MKALIDTASDRILGFTAFAVEAGEIMDAVQIAMIGGLPYTALRDAIFTHPTMLEGLIPLFTLLPANSEKPTSSTAKSARTESIRPSAAAAFTPHK